MDLLEFGMKNQNSSSPVKKAAAKGALAAARVQADLYEQYLERTVPLPEDPEGTERMRKRIEEAIQSKEEK